MKNKAGLLIVLISISLSAAAQETGTFKDIRDEQVYKTVKIGNQLWMAENMNYYSKNLFYERNDSNMPRSDYRTENYTEKYGLLYSFNVAQKVCPAGWHLPSDKEWKKLELYIGLQKDNVNSDSYLRGYEVVGKLLSKSSLWESGYGSEKITNATGFNVLPGGYGWFKHKPDAGGGLNISYYAEVGKEAYFWTSTNFKPHDYSNFTEAVTRIFRTKEIRNVPKNTHNRFHSVRCIKD